MQKFGIGQPALRLEDIRLLKGQGQYTDDLRREGTAVGYVLRSPYANAAIKSIDTQAAASADGVLAVYTAADLEGEVGSLPCLVPLQGRDGKPIAAPERHVLAKDHVRYVGEPVAFVVAESRNAARSAAELIEVDYAPEDAVAGPEAALADGAPQVFEGAPGNVSVDWEVGDEAAVKSAFDAAAQVIRLKVVHNRVVPHAMETRAAIAEWSDADGFSITVGSQGVFSMRDIFAALFSEAPDRIRVITKDVGGGFGMKGFVFHEYPLVMFAARKLGRPVKWTGDRSEAFLNDTHGRDLVSDAALAFDAEGKILAYRVDTVANLGAYLSMFAPFIQTMAPVQITGGVYRIPAIYVNVKNVLTHTAPIDAYRGAGRPEAAYVLERVMSYAAAELGIAQDDLRRRNFIPRDAMPYTTAMGTTFDTGAFEETMDKARALADWDGFAKRRAESEAQGKLRGLGMAYYIECTLGAPSDDVTLGFTREGKVELAVGTQSQGQGHATTFVQIVADRLGVDLEDVVLVEGDTARKATGGGTGGSTSLQRAGNAAVAACEEAVERGKKLAAIVLEAEDISYEDGLFQAAGTNRTVPILELTEAIADRNDIPDELKDGLNCTGTYTMAASTFPNGCHIAEVEVDPETGTAELVAYSVVDDFGVVINPMVVAGQVHGGVVQGIGQALTEHCVYEEGSGQLVTGSFMDYGMPRADNMPEIKFEMNPVPCETNALGIKGCGEAGTIGACPSFMNAVIDALSVRGVRKVDMPATPESLWRALQAAE